MLGFVMRSFDGDRGQHPRWIKILGLQDCHQIVVVVAGFIHGTHPQLRTLCFQPIQIDRCGFGLFSQTLLFFLGEIFNIPASNTREVRIWILTSDERELRYRMRGSWVCASPWKGSFGSRVSCETVGAFENSRKAVWKTKVFKLVSLLKLLPFLDQGCTYRFFCVSRLFWDRWAVLTGLHLNLGAQEGIEMG